MSMNALVLGIVLACVLVCQGQETGETEIIRFTYEHATQMMVITRQSTCYLFTLTDAEKSVVHIDSTLRTLELKLLGELADPNLVLTPIPSSVMHSNLHKECGRDMTNYYIVTRQ